MMRIAYRSALGLLAAAVTTGTACAQTASEDAELTKPDALERPWVWYPTAACPEPTSGPGDSPDNPIEVDDFRLPWFSALVWSDPQKGQENQKWELENEIEPTPDLNCKWVRISGHFRRNEYYHYRGILTQHSRDLYLFNGGPGNKIRNTAYFVESWSDPSVRSAMINGADIEIVGRFYDLCRAARQDEAASGEDWIIMGGPCHYGSDTGMMIEGARVTMVKSKPFQRLKGEINRSVIGNIREVERSWPDFDAVKAAVAEEISAVRKGTRYYWTHALSDWEPNEDKIEERVSDPDNWISFLADDPESPLNASRRPIEKNEFRIYRLASYGGGETEEQINIAIACFCTRRTCGDVWPLFWEDATDFHNDYLCFTLNRDYDDKRKWR